MGPSSCQRDTRPAFLEDAGHIYCAMIPKQFPPMGQTAALGRGVARLLYSTAKFAGDIVEALQAS